MNSLKNLFFTFLVLFLAFLTVILISTLIESDPYLIEVKRHGTEHEKFYLLLEERAKNIGGQNVFRSGFTEDQRKQFMSFLQEIRYRENCTKGSSKAVTGGMSCLINGQVLDYTDWQNIDYNGH